MIDRLVILGAGGDLATRHLLPALAHLHGNDLLPPSMRVVALGRARLTSQEFRHRTALHLAEHASQVSPATRAALVSRLDYVQADLDQQPNLREVVGERAVIAYLALPPSVYPAALRALRGAGIAAGSRIVVEKPFGEDLESGRELNRLLHAVVDERNVFRVDHFLYHQVVQDLLALRFATPLFEPLWNRNYIERVEITWEEASGVAGRAPFYDRTGALRDMVQSHLLQLLALVAMEAPEAFDEQCLRAEKVAVLRQVRSLTPGEASTATARGRYGAGSAGGRAVPAYVQEPGVDASGGTETWAALRLSVDLPRWEQVPLILRTGKALGHPRRRIAVHFRVTPETGLAVSNAPAVLSFDMIPERISLELRAAGRDGLPGVEPLVLVAPRPPQRLPPSARILRDVLAGDPTLTVRDDESEECWRIVDSVLAGWRTGVPDLQDYPAGSSGPATVL